MLGFSFSCASTYSAKAGAFTSVSIKQAQLVPPHASRRGVKRSTLRQAALGEDGRMRPYVDGSSAFTPTGPKVATPSAAIGWCFFKKAQHCARQAERSSPDELASKR